MRLYDAMAIAEGMEPASDEQRIDAWQELIDSGMAWQMVGYAQAAEQLIEAGTIHPILH